MNARTQTAGALAPPKARSKSGAKSGPAAPAPGKNGAPEPRNNGAPATPGHDSPFFTALDRLLTVFTSLRLTVICLVLGMVLVFAGTIAQVEIGLFKAQNEFFRSFFVYLGPKGVSWKLPVFPGGYLVGGVLLINLVASHIKRFTFSRTKLGIWMIHFGLILLLLGQLGTDILSRESVLHLRDGQAKNYSESDRQCELAVIDTTAPDLNTVVAIPQAVLMGHKDIQNPALPFTIRVRDFYPNSMVQDRGTNSAAPPAATHDIGAVATVRPLPRVTQTDFRDRPSAVVELRTPDGSQGTWLVSDFISGPQAFTYNAHRYEMVLRPRRYYEPFTIRLNKFRHDIYAGTEIPKNFSSRIQLENPQTGENREILIKMNRPLRYAGETFYQASFDPDNGGTVLEVVHNPSWLTPYLACVIVGLGLVYQFATHLLGFTFKRRKA
jgi:ResB-like family